MSAIDYILIILVLASLYLNWHLVQVCRSAMKARKKALRDAQRLLKRGEEAQEQAIVDKRRFLEALGEAFLLIGPAGHIVLANTLAKELFQEERLEGRKVGALVCNQELLGHVQEAFDTDGPVTKEFTLSAANSPGGVQNGITAWHLDSAITDTPIKEKRILLRNVTQNYLTNQMRRDFVANASHELRTPIAAVATNLDAPLSQGRFPADVEPAIRRALAANRRGSDLVQALLTLSRIQSGVIDAEDVTALQLADFIDDELAEVEEQADKRNILVTTRDVAGDVQVQASKSLMDLAIGNLLRNAIMHNISSGTLDIAARQEHCAIIVTITNSTDETLPDDLMNLKQPFHRGEHSRISAEPGVGLGLSIADAACEAMGATLELDRPDEQSFRATITIASA